MLETRHCQYVCFLREERLAIMIMVKQNISRGLSGQSSTLGARNLQPDEAEEGKVPRRFRHAGSGILWHLLAGDSVEQSTTCSLD